MPDFRLIPSIESVLARAAVARAAARHGRDRATAAARQAAEELRTRLRQQELGSPDSEHAAAAWLEARVLALLDAGIAPSLTRVINATGVVLHTNLGRAPLAAEAIARIAEVAAGYANLEYDLDAGARGHRHVHAERLLSSLTGAEAALVVNNNAAATLARAGRARCWTRGDRLARRAGRDRRRVPRAGRDGAVRRDPARSRHDQPHARERLRRGHQRPHGAHPARAPVEFPDRRLHRAARSRGAGRPRPPVQSPAVRGPGQRLARARGRHRHRRCATSRRSARACAPAPISSRSAATSSSAARRPASSSAGAI